MMSSEFPSVSFICPIHQTKLELVSTTKEGLIYRCEKCDASTLHNGEIFISHEKYKQVTWTNISL